VPYRTNTNKKKWEVVETLVEKYIFSFYFFYEKGCLLLMNSENASYNLLTVPLGGSSGESGKQPKKVASFCVECLYIF
jgi:hypothetical protein